MDPLSDILSLLGPNSYGFRGLDASGDWLLAFGRDDGIKCYAIQSGACWLAMEGAGEPVRLEAGDFVLLPSAQAFRIYSTADAPPIDAFDFFPEIPAGETAVLNGGGGVAGVGGYFGFEGMHADLLLGMLPPVVHIRAEASKAELRWSIDRLMCELREPQPGSALIAEHLAQALLRSAAAAFSRSDEREPSGTDFRTGFKQPSRIKRVTVSGGLGPAARQYARGRRGCFALRRTSRPNRRICQARHRDGPPLRIKRRPESRSLSWLMKESLPRSPTRISFSLAI